MSYTVPLMGGGGGLAVRPECKGAPNSAELISGFRLKSMTNGYSSGLHRSYLKQNVH